MCFFVGGVGFWIPGSIVKDTGFLSDSLFFFGGGGNFNLPFGAEVFFVLIGGSENSHLSESSMTLAERVVNGLFGGSIH